MRYYRSLQFIGKLLATSIKASASIREAFLLEVLFLFSNNLIFFGLWFIFFDQFQTVGGWQLENMITLIATGTGGYGLMRVCCGGIRDLAKRIVGGEIDPYMTRPKNLLIHLIGSRSLARGWGHILTSVVLIIYNGLTDPAILGTMLLCIFCIFLLFSSCGIMAHSLGFWMGPIENLCERYSDAIFLFSMYPTNIYSGFLQIVMFTVIPAGIIGYIPVELVKEFSWVLLGVLVSSTILFCAIAVWVFYAGLKRYESGNQIG